MVYFAQTTGKTLPVSVFTHLADRGVLRGENSRLVAAPETLFLPVFLPCCRRPELGAPRGLNIPAVWDPVLLNSRGIYQVLTEKRKRTPQTSPSNLLQTARGAVA